jgi:peroxiredoxin
MKWRSLPESGAYSDMRPLAEQLAERQALAERFVPAETQAVHARVVEELQEAGLARHALGVGAAAPEFALANQDGETVALREQLTQGPVVLMFFRGRWCPFCVGQLEAMNFLLPAFSDVGATLLAISPQSVKQNFLMRDQHHLRFPLLADAGNAVARQFGLVYRVPGEQQNVYSSVLINLPFANGDAKGEEKWELPIPAVYVVDRDGTIVWARADEDYKRRPEPAEILRFLESL